MPLAKTIPAAVLQRAQELAAQCEQEQRPERMRSWDDLPAWLRDHWIDKAQGVELCDDKL